MAETLADEVRVTDGFKAECLHLDLKKGEEAVAKNCARLEARVFPESTSTPRRGSSRHRASEERPGAAAEVDTPLLSEGAPLCKKTVAWETRDTMRGRHSQRQETADRSGGLWGKGEHRSKGKEAGSFVYKDM